jgi:nucleotide-binding universal stress UspA family protein
MIHKILFATDFSDGSKPALEQAVQLTRATQAELLVLHVREEFPFVAADGFGYVPPELESQQRAAVAELLDEQTAELQKQGVTCRGLSVLGSPHLRIANVAEQEKVDMIVLGTHGRSGLGRLMLGSVAERVARTSTVPVLVVRAPRAS